MKESGRKRFKVYKQEARTLKFIEENKQKVDFFDELLIELEGNFPKEQILFFMGNNYHDTKVDKKRDKYRKSNTHSIAESLDDF